MYVLRVMPTSKEGTLSVAVYVNGRLLGLLSTAVSNQVIPSLKLLGGAAITNGTGTRSAGTRLWVNVPTSADLAAFVETWRP